jgi:hypothetical protein
MSYMLQSKVLTRIASATPTLNPLKKLASASFITASDAPPAPYPDPGVAPRTGGAAVYLSTIQASSEVVGYSS